MFGWLKFAVQLFIGIYLLVAAFLYVFPIAKFYIYKMGAEKIITERTDLTVEKTVKLLVEEAEDMGIKLGKDNIKVESRDDTFHITIQYTTLYTIPLTKKTYEFAHIIKGVKHMKEIQ
jgi:hypothetical protein